MYEKYKEVIEYKIRSGSDFEKVEASFVKQVALGEIKSKLRWRTPPQATGYVRATALVVMED